jgi:hypothetical protein
MFINDQKGQKKKKKKKKNGIKMITKMIYVMKSPIAGPHFVDQYLVMAIEESHAPSH